jgi:hypothetical protein
MRIIIIIVVIIITSDLKSSIPNVDQNTFDGMEKIRCIQCQCDMEAKIRWIEDFETFERLGTTERLS